MAEYTAEDLRCQTAIPMLPNFPIAFEHAISKPRLDSYKGYFRTNTANETIGLYMWNTELATCFGSLLSLFEISLRNNIHRAMSRQYCEGAVSGHWYDAIYHSLKPRTQQKINDVRHEGHGHSKRLRRPAPSADEIVSRVSFGFWPGVLSIISSGYSASIFPMIFPHHSFSATPTDWANGKNRKNALASIYDLNNFRNRLAHHEPLWKFGAVYDTSVQPPLLVHPATKNQVDSIGRLKRLLTTLDRTIEMMNQDFYSDFIQCSWRMKLDYLLTDRGFSRYKTTKYCPASTSITPSVFRREFPLIVRNNQPVRLAGATKGGVFIPD